MKQVYLHGLGQTPDAWEKTIQYLGTAEHSTCLDLAKLLQGREATYQNLYVGMSTVCDTFDAPIDLCGLSLGSVLALNYAIDHPERVKRLVLIAPQYKMPKNLLRFQNLMFRFMPKAMFRETGFEKAAFIRLCKTMMRLDFSAFAGAIACPTLVLCGETDKANQKAAMELTALLRQGELQMISGAGHEVNIDAPEKLAEALHVFFNRPW